MEVSTKGEGVINIAINGKRLKQVDRFRYHYPGALITSDGRCEVEIKAGIGMAKNTFNQSKQLLSKSLNKDMKKRIINAIIWSVAPYIGNTYMHRKPGHNKKEDIRRLEAFEMWVWKRLEKIGWRDRKTNEEVL